MAEYLIQDTTLTGIADAIRAKDKSSDTIQVSSFASRIAAISTGVEVKKNTGTYKTSSSGTATVTCGFQPDIVTITLNETSSSSKVYAVSIPFLEYSGKTISVAMWGEDYEVYEIDVTRSTTGFSVTKTTGWDTKWQSETVKSETFTYTAYKIT